LLTHPSPPLLRYRRFLSNRPHRFSPRRSPH